MNTDERIEALTQSVELLASMQRETGRHIVKMSDAITRLANIAEAHEQRIEELEGN